jgi:hypothetical protein
MPEEKESNIKLWCVIIVVICVLTTAWVLCYHYLGVDNPPVWHTTPLNGYLNYLNTSTPENGKASFELYLESPRNISILNMTILLRNRNEKTINNFSYSWNHITSENFISEGDIFTIEIPNVNLRGYTVVIQVKTYHGIINGDVPLTS